MNNIYKYQQDIVLCYAVELLLLLLETSINRSLFNNASLLRDTFKKF